MIMGDRIQLVPLAPEHFELTLKWINNPELRVMTGTRFPVSCYEHEAWFQSHATNPMNKTYVITVKEPQEPIGIVGNADYDPIHRLTNMFLYIGEDGARSMGYGQESLRLFGDFCFDELNVHKLTAYIFAYNQASRKLFEKCGYSLEGTLKKHWFKKGEYHDVLVMGAIRE